VLEPSELVRQAAEAGVRLLSVTDHDNLAGFREAAAGPVPDGIEVIPGVEINAVAGREGFWEGEVHVIGLGMDPANAGFEVALAGQRGQRRLRFERMLQRLRELHMPVDDEIERLDLTDDDALGRPTIARALIARGHAESVEDAFRRWLGHGMPAWVPRDGLGPKGAIEAIRAAGGLPVLAHFAEAAERIGVVRELVDVGLGGLEVHYRSWNRATVETVAGVARALRLVATGGSDYHGDFGPYAESHASLWVPPEVGEQLRHALASESGGG
jgi:3',5'-nucleoside bisphosphate phosphatase